MRRMVEEYRQIVLALDGNYVSIPEYGGMNLKNMYIFRLDPNTGHAEDVTKSSITYELFLLETIAHHSLKKESIDYWINQINIEHIGKGVREKLHRFIDEDPGDLFSLKEDIIRTSKTGIMLLKDLGKKIYGAELDGMAKEKLNKPGYLNVDGRNIMVPSPEIISDEIRLLEELEKSTSYPFLNPYQFEKSESSQSLRPLPKGCEVKKIKGVYGLPDIYKLFICGNEMVTADSGKFYLLDAEKKLFDTMHMPREGDGMLSDLKKNVLIDDNNKRTDEGQDIYNMLKILGGKASKSRQRSLKKSRMN